AAAPDSPAGGFRIEMLRGDPVLRGGGGRRGRGGASGGPAILNLRTGLPVAELSVEEVLDVAAQFGRGNSIEGTPRMIGPLDVDQWTIQSARRNQPAYHIAFDDPRGHEIYISAASGDVFQATS